MNNELFIQSAFRISNKTKKYTKETLYHNRDALTIWTLRCCFVVHTSQKLNSRKHSRFSINVKVHTQLYCFLSLLEVKWVFMLGLSISSHRVWPENGWDTEGVPKLFWGSDQAQKMAPACRHIIHVNVHLYNQAHIGALFSETFF